MSDTFKEGIRQYMLDNSRLNGLKAMEKAEQNRQAGAKGVPLDTSPPQYIAPSFNDMLYWVNKTGHYEFLNEEQ